ncbi:hypothetical protein RHMOL_Rhmol12G0050400 [Rhododendron molle]|uniref:Uncharacterized protein n=1 Tax=Rhododendron molle TaxID=49168 RepID=A0ACC0LG34_RHOML|nr:hypothetical protein RHMOL_Rhmol12G0050400 [Rhododendron molle]
MPVDPNVIPEKSGKEPCPYWQCFKNDIALRLFREVYRIPDDVVVSPIVGPRIKFSDEHIMVQLMAITEGGLCFPMHRIIRELLYTFNLTPCQLSVNTYRLVHSVAKLTEINHALLKRCRNQRSLEAAILFFPVKERDAPAILEYTTTYQGFIRQKETPLVAAEETVQPEEKVEEVFEDSFGEIPEILRSSIQRPLQGKLRVAREEAADEEGEEEVEMAPRDILVDLEKRKKKRQKKRGPKPRLNSDPRLGI